MKRFKTFILLLSVSFLTYNCATIISGSKQDVKIWSSPSNAKVTINDKFVGNTPLIKSIKRKKNNISIKVELDGYETHTTTLYREFNSWYFWNFLFGGVIGLIVDPITGAIYKLSPEQVSAVLREFESGRGGFKNNNPIYIRLTHENSAPDPEWEKVGEIKRE